jgi:AcrR family transcriptional regulator
VAENTRDDGGGRRGRKRAATRVAITDAARSLTAAHGVNGFTIEQLCEDVGISRRTFFNYFPGKEDAILGDPMDHIPEALARVFVEGGAGFPADEISPTMLPDFIELACAMMDRLAMSRDDVVRLRGPLRPNPNFWTRPCTGPRRPRKPSPNCWQRGNACCLKTCGSGSPSA